MLVHMYHFGFMKLVRMFQVGGPGQRANGAPQWMAAGQQG